MFKRETLKLLQQNSIGCDQNNNASDLNCFKRQICNSRIKINGSEQLTIEIEIKTSNKI